MAVVLWTVRLAALLYVAALAAWLAGRWEWGRRFWIAGVPLFLAHVAAAFAVVHGWSHNAAYADTARQTEALFGVRDGSGIYWNYVFTATWAADAVWIALWPRSYRRRPGAVSVAVHAFLGFMMFNAAVVFPAGATRWVSLAAMALLAGLWWRRGAIMSGHRT